jgi:hypothetical protein
MNPQQTPSEPKSNLVEAELQHNIPVKPHIEEQHKNPITSAKHILDHDNKSDKDLEHVLNDVNKSVKEADKKPSKGSFSLFQKKHSAGKLPKEQLPPKSSKFGPSKPIGVVAAAAVVACGLIFTAFYSLSPNASPSSKEKPITKAASSASQPAASSSEIKAADLTKLASDLTTQINALSDAQDFNPTDLSDTNLGL